LEAKNEKIYKSLADECGGVYGTLEEAIAELGLPRLKVTRPVTSYKGMLDLGDPEKYQTAMSIDVERYPRTMVRRPATASSYVNQDATGGAASAQSSVTLRGDTDLVGVRSNRVYVVHDETEKGGKRVVDGEELARGYEYGRTAVHISETDQTVTTLETRAALEIVGFIQQANVYPPPNLVGSG
jgi:ATP-dependent DNA helicase 2 subunit 2